MDTEKLKEILRTVCDIKDMEIKEESSLKDDLHMSSFSFMMLMAELENTLECEIRPDIFIGMETVEDLYKRLQDMLGEKK